MNSEANVTLKVAEALQEDVSYARARLDTQSRIQLGIDVGDIIEIRGAKTTAAVVWRMKSQGDEGKGMIRIEGLLRHNAGVSIGDKVLVRKAEVGPAENVTIAPMIQGPRIRLGPGIENIIKRGLLGRPMIKGDIITVPGIALMGNTLPFVVVNSGAKGIVKITEDTDIIVKEEPVDIGDITTSTITYEDIGGLKEELQRVREMIELPLKHPELFDRLGIDPPKGVLLHGPPGTGKTLIAKAVANEAGVNFYSIQGPEIMGKYYGQSEERHSPEEGRGAGRGRKEGGGAAADTHGRAECQRQPDRDCRHKQGGCN